MDLRPLATPPGCAGRARRIGNAIVGSAFAAAPSRSTRLAAAASLGASLGVDLLSCGDARLAARRPPINCTPWSIVEAAGFDPHQVGGRIAGMDDRSTPTKSLPRSAAIPRSSAIPDAGHSSIRRDVASSWLVLPPLQRRDNEHANRDRRSDRLCRFAVIARATIADHRTLPAVCASIGEACPDSSRLPGPCRDDFAPLAHVRRRIRYPRCAVTKSRPSLFAHASDALRTISFWRGGRSLFSRSSEP